MYEFGAEIIRRFDLHGTCQNGQYRNVVVVYQDPANKSQTGTGHSVRDQLNEALSECNLGAIDGSNDRIGGWLLMYQMLTRGRWLIADTCPLLIAAIRSRVHDPKKPGDLLKVGGDPLDDAMDAARYGLYSWVTASEKPLELRMRQAVAGLDLTSANIRWLQNESRGRIQGPADPPRAPPDAALGAIFSVSCAKCHNPGQ